MRDEPLKKCPKCHKAALKRLVGGGAGLIFKGSGFYITDYKKAKGAMAKAATPRRDSKGRPRAPKAGRRRKGAGRGTRREGRRPRTEVPKEVTYPP
jgi:hypothetical protein